MVLHPRTRPHGFFMVIGPDQRMVKAQKGPRCRHATLNPAHLWSRSGGCRTDARGHLRVRCSSRTPSNVERIDGPSSGRHRARSRGVRALPSAGLSTKAWAFLGRDRRYCDHKGLTRRLTTSVHTELYLNRRDSDMDTEHATPESGLVEPIAILGMSCRLPGGVNSSSDLWRLLAAGDDGIGVVPEGRWDAYESRAPGQLRGIGRTGGFLSNAAAFDARFFGITPREAEQMDPQQRILLELAWESLEDASIRPSTIAGTSAGVFIGVGSDDYGRQMLEDIPRIEAWTGIGASMCATANRISYHLDLHGPSMAVDTACSSSLVSVHLACQALRSRETELAIAGGVNIMAGPGLTKVLDAAGATSPDGTSKSFDASANGYGRGEGAGVVVLKRLSDAQRDGDRVLAVVRGSSVRQDGRTKGIMAPNGDAQAEVARQALRVAGVDPRTVHYVEAHGTGTRAGDPIEATALSSVYGAGRGGSQPCLIGSVKPNIGHLEAGAGIAGLMKVVLAIRHGYIPPTIRHSVPTPAIDWASSGLSVVTTLKEWPAHEGPKRAGVSSFGYGGTVAHMVLEEAPATAIRRAAKTEHSEAQGPLIFPLSGNTDESVIQYATRLQEYLDSAPTVSIGGVAKTLGLGREHMGHRTAVTATNYEELRRELQVVASGTEPDKAPVAASEPHHAVWVFSGHGSQWSGMGQDLLANDRAFQEAIRVIDAVFLEESGFAASEVIRKGDLGGTDRIQPMIYAMQVGITQSLRSRGLAPAAVIGHSVGEIAAGVAAGIMDIEAGARLVSRRSALLRRVIGAGAMAMVAEPFHRAKELLQGKEGIEAAIFSSTASSVVSGTPEAVSTFVAACEEEGVRVRAVASDVAFHSKQMDPLCDELAAAVDGLATGTPQVSLYTTALENPRSTAERDGAYWAANLRNPVRFVDAVTAAVNDGHTSFIEIAPHPVVTHSLTETLEDQQRPIYISGTLRRQKPERELLAQTIAGAHNHGVLVDWTCMVPVDEPFFELPGRVWSHRDYWRTGQPSGSRTHNPQSETLLGGMTELADGSGTRVWESTVDFQTRPYPGQHPIMGTEVLPAAVHLTTFLAAFDSNALTDVELRVPLTLTDAREVQVIRDHHDSVKLLSRRADVDGEIFSHHSSAQANRDDAWPLADVDLEDWSSLCTVELDSSLAQSYLQSVGVSDIGFPWSVSEIRKGDDNLLARVVAEAEVGENSARGWGALFDAVLSVAPVLFPGEAKLRMPSAIGSVRTLRPAPTEAAILVSFDENGPASGSTTVTVQVVEESGAICARFDELTFSEVDGPGTSDDTLVYDVRWEEVSVEPSRTLDHVFLLGDAQPLRAAVEKSIGAAGVSWTAVAEDEYALLGNLENGKNQTVLVLPDATTASRTLAESSPATVFRIATVLREVNARASAGTRVCALTLAGTDGAGDQYAPVWGMSSILATEHPGTWSGVVDLDPRHLERAADKVLDVLRSAIDEPVIAVSDRAVLVRRFRPTTLDTTQAPITCDPRGTYLITGGLGALGLATADWLVERGATRLVLASRSGLNPRSTWDMEEDPAVRQRIAAIRALEDRGVTVATVAVDIADPIAAAERLSADALGLPPVRGVVHAAGVVQNETAHELTYEAVEAVFSPKVAGGEVLDELYPAGSLDFCVYFSSVGQFLGLTGQTSYAAANASLDALAYRRRSESAGDRTVSIAWTSWRDMGLGAHLGVELELSSLGAANVSREEALRSWDFVSRTQAAHAVVVRVLELAPDGPAVLRGLENRSADSATSDDAAGPRTLSDENFSPNATQIVAVETARIIGDSVENIDQNRPFTDLGLDSVMTMAVRANLQKRLGVRLPANVLWEHPTVNALGIHLAENLSARTPEASNSN